MNIFVIGQCTLHWGRMEFGNLGNCYIVEPFFRELHRVFPNAIIRTTLQMSDEFCQREDVECVPMDEYYCWSDNDLITAYKELAIAQIYNETNRVIDTTPYIKEVLNSDLVIELAGDIWGRNADFLGPNRFLVGLIKDRIPQLMGKHTVMLASSPGPFNKDETLPFARKVFESFDYVANREPISRKVLSDYGFDVSQVKDSACPAFLFEPASQYSIKELLKGTPLENKSRPTVGFILSGWNLLKGPYNRTDWDDEEFSQYVKALSGFMSKYDVDICFMSHSNGFELKPEFKPIKGRDYPFAKRMFDLMSNTEFSNHVYLMDGIYDAKDTKAIISNFDMLISGKIHGAVAGLSQNVPTVIIDYGHEPKAHKLLGFACVAGVEDYIANPADTNDIMDKVLSCWENRVEIKKHLEIKNKEIRNIAKSQFDALRIFEN